MSFKKINNLILFILLSVNITAQIKPGLDVRIKKNFNKNWKFILDDAIEFSNEDFNDANWRNIDLPHDWSVEYEFSKENSGRNAWLPGGIGWYRKEFNLPDNYKNKHVEIQFDGAYRHSQVWINGEHVGIQYDGYTSFYFDISPYLKFGEKNVIAVKVDNSIQPNCRWYSGSGIYRNTWLLISDKLHVANWGTYITTPKVSKEKAIVNIETTVENFRGNVDFILQTTIYNSKGENVGFTETEVNARLLKKYTFEQQITIDSPSLWSDRTPNMYIAITQLVVDTRVVDDYKSNFGIRSIRFDAEKGFFLNGENIKMKGVCLHHDAGVLGAAVPIEVWERRLKILKGIGCNAIRTAHNPAAPEFMDLCDEMGFLVMNEFVDKWYDNVPWNTKKSSFFNPNGFGDPYFYLEWQKNYQQTIFRDRNHPSVIIWSVGNENHSPGDNRQNYGLKKYASFVRTLDPTRPVISGMERGKDGDPVKKVNDIIESCSYMDLIALNYGEQWCKEIGSRTLGKLYISTESYVYFNSTPEKRFANIEKSPWLDVLKNDFNMGLFLWSGIDYLGESKKYPKLGSDSGLLDLAGFRKEVSYLYEAFWSEKPIVRIAVYEGDADDFSTSGRWGVPPMNATWNFEKGKAYDLVTYTNCDSVDLYLNGKKLGNKKLSEIDNFIMKWRAINYQPGSIKAVGIINGKEVCEFVLNTAGKPHHFNFNIYKKEGLKRGDIVQVEVEVVDEKENLISHKETVLNFHIEGGGEIIGISNGSINDTTDNFNTTSRFTKKGKCLVIIKIMNSVDNNVKLKVSSKTVEQEVVIKLN
ncbi:glycoside hydrolase family 2 protein [Lutibacter sp. A80]|uniref:glycoside hydrolase family 2 TIM barrel-domain containing protein n=1 Tax=Lutibacter sp. A80 TaxID=2918453 RepID=UPI001F069E67|nr:glycoside hydrolase family 2 TIM barrel-domain containing protein [Lutibacter sp. A80]UMB61720.1 glycoside hydrolase family 2 protein [Lutibacter sp. A80]